MRRIGGTLATACLLALAPALVWAETPATSIDHLEFYIVEVADTPAEHQALAGYYRAKAANAQRLAEHHRTMAKRYHGKPGEMRKMRKHCDNLVRFNEQIAAEYESLAKGHDTKASE